MYDRLISYGRFAPRPVRTGGPTEKPPPHVHGDVGFRRHPKRTEGWARGAADGIVGREDADRVMAAGRREENVLRAVLERVCRLLLVVAIAAGPVAVRAAPTGKPRFLGGYHDWDAFTLTERTGQKICYIVSVPKSWSASRRNARRGRIYVTVTHRPRAKIRDQVNFVMGYPLKSDSEVTVTVDGKTRLKLFTEGDGAWTYSEKDDRRLVAAMKRGLKMTVIGVSRRGTRTTDRYSLKGFTAAYNAISKACGLR